MWTILVNTTQGDGKIHKQYVHPTVTKFLVKHEHGGRFLYIYEGVKGFVYDGSRVISVLIREHKRSGVQ